MLALGISRADEPGLRLCADEWMPFNGGAEAESPGYVIELARAIFTPRGIAVTYTVMPWEDALSSVREGRMNAVIGANTAEAIDLAFAHNDAGRKHAAIFDESRRAMRASGDLEKILRRCGLRDWQ